MDLFVVPFTVTGICLIQAPEKKANTYLLLFNIPLVHYTAFAFTVVVSLAREWIALHYKSWDKNSLESFQSA